MGAIASATPKHSAAASDRASRPRALFPNSVFRDIMQAEHRRAAPVPYSGSSQNDLHDHAGGDHRQDDIAADGEIGMASGRAGQKVDQPGRGPAIMTRWADAL